MQSRQARRAVARRLNSKLDNKQSRVRARKMPICSAAIAAAALAVMHNSVRADNVFEWYGSSDNNWNNASNWAQNVAVTVPTLVPGSTADGGDAAVFNHASANTTIAVGSNHTIRDIVFDTPFASSYTIGAGGADNLNVISIGVAGGTQPIIWDSSTVTAASETVNNPITFALTTQQNYTVENDSPLSSLTLNGNVTFTEATAGQFQGLLFGGVGSIAFNGSTSNAGPGVSYINKYASGFLTLGGTIATTTTGTNTSSVYSGTMSLTPSASFATGSGGTLNIGVDYTSTAAVLQVQAASTSSKPLGDGNISLQQGSQLQIVGSGTGTSSILIASASGKKLGLNNGGNTISLSAGSLTTLTATIGAVAPARTVTSTLTVAVPDLTTLGTSNQLILTGAATASAAKDSNNASLGFAQPYYIGKNTTTGAADFLTFNATTGFAPLSATPSNYTGATAVPMSSTTGGNVFLVDSPTVTESAAGKLWAVNTGSNTLNLGAAETFGGASADLFGVLMDGGTIAGTGGLASANNAEGIFYTTANGGTYSAASYTGGTAGITKFGAGTLNVFSANFSASTGSLTVNEGTVNIGSGATAVAKFVPIYDGAINIQNGGTLNATGGTILLNNASAKLNVASGGAMTGTTALTVTGGTATFNSALVNFTGTTTIGNTVADNYNGDVPSENTRNLAMLRVNPGATMGTGSVSIISNGFLSLSSLDQLSPGNLALGGGNTGFASGLEAANGTTATSFTRPLSAAGAGGFQWVAGGSINGAFAARDGTLTIAIAHDLLNSSGTLLTPGGLSSTGTANTGVPSSLNFGSPNANSPVVFTNPILVGNTGVTVSVADNQNSTGDYAIFTQPITPLTTPNGNNTGTGAAFNKSGNGLLVLSSPTALTNFVPSGQLTSTSTRFFDGVLRLTNVSALPPSNKFTLSMNVGFGEGDNNDPAVTPPAGTSFPDLYRPIFETNGLFTPNATGVGSLLPASNILFNNAAGGGFSAYGTNPLGDPGNNLTINYGDNGTLTSTQNYTTFAGIGTFGVVQLTLGSIYTNATTIIQNPIALNVGLNSSALVYVNQGVNSTGTTARPEGEFDGGILQFGTLTENFQKDGPGTLLSTAANTYTGATNIVNGTYRITNNNGLGYGGQSALNAPVGQTTVTGTGAASTLDISGVTVNEPIVLSGGFNGATLINSNTSTTSVIGNGVAGIQLTNAGGGYAGAITAVISGGGGTGATATAGLVGSGIGTIASTAAGSGYSSAPTVTINGASGGSGSATATAVLSSVALNGVNNSIGGAGNMIINAPISDGTLSGGFMKVGAGVLTLSAANTYSGNTTVAAGGLIVTNTAGSATGSGAVNLTGPGASLGGAGAIAGAVTLGGGTTITPGSTALGLGTLTTGAFTLGAGTQAFTFRLGNGTFANDTLLVNGNNGLTINGNASDKSFTFIPTGVVNVGTFDLIRYAGAVQGAAATSLNSYLAGVNINSGRTVGTLVNDTANSAIAFDVTSTDTIKWTAAMNQNWDINTSVDWQQILHPLPGGTIYLQSGPVGDTVTFDDSATVANSTVSLVTNVAPALMNFTNTTAVPYTINSGGAGTFVINGIGSLNKTGNGLVTLNTSNTFTGATSVSAGTLVVGTTGSLGSGTYNVNNATLAVNGNLTGSPTINLASGTVSLANATTIAGLNGDGTSLLANNGTLTVAGLNDSTFGGIIAGAGSIVKQGAGAFTVAGPNTFAGTTTISAGTLRLGTASTLQNSTVVIAGGALDLNNLNPTIGGVSGAATAVLNIPNTGQTLTVGANNGAATFSGSITGSGNLATTGSGTFTLGGTWVSTGAVGSLTVGGTGTTVLAVGRLGGATPITVNPGATLALAPGGNGFILGVNANPNLIPLTLNGTLELNSDSPGFGSSAGPFGGGIQGIGTLQNSATTGYSAFDNTSDLTQAFSGTIQGNLRFVRRGNSPTSVLTLSGTNTFNGQLEVRGSGTLVTADIGNTNGATVLVTSDSNLGNPIVSSVEGGSFGYAVGGPNVVWLGNNVVGMVGNGYQGTLEVSGNSFTSTNRQIFLDHNGGVIQVDSPTNVFTVFGPVSTAATSGFGYNAGTSGFLTKSGPGTLVLNDTDTFNAATMTTATTGQETYNGPTNVVNGTLNLSSQLTASNVITVDATNFASNLVLNVANAVPATATVTGISGTSTVPTVTVNSGQNFASLTSSGTTFFAGGTSTIGAVAGTGAIVVSSPATVTASSGFNPGSVVSTGTINVTGGIANSVATIDGAGTLNVTSGATLTSTHINHKYLGIGSTSTVTIPANTLAGTTTSTTVLTTLANSGTLNLANNDMILTDVSQYTATKAAIANAYDAGNWDKSGITSSSAAAASANFALGYAQASTIGSTSFDGKSFTDAVLVKYTLKGDTKLRGTVGGGDYNTVVSNFDTAQDWSGGDFNYDGVVSGGDYNNVVANFDANLTSSVVNGASKLSLSASRARTFVGPLLTNAAAAPASTDIRLEVNTTTGDVELLATTASTLTLYNVQDSVGKHLVTANLITLGSRYPNFTTISKKATAIAEGQDNSAYTSGDSSTYDTIAMSAGQMIDLGAIYSPTAGTKTLSFEFTEANPTTGDPTTGPDFTNAGIDYVSAPEPASFSILGIAAVGLLSRRRRRANVATI